MAKRRFAILIVSSVVAACPLVVAGGSHAQAAESSMPADGYGVWHNAIQVPGLAALNQGGNATVSVVSCPAPGDCSAAGDYTDGSRHGQVFVADEMDGIWHDAIEVPGTAALNTGGLAFIYSMSCPSVGSCVAAGTYSGRPGSGAFVADKVGGVWHDAIDVPGLVALGGSGAIVTSVSCATSGNCSAGGVYFDATSRQHDFVVSEVHRVWGSAIEVPGTAALNPGGLTSVNAVSCGAAGNCSAGGYYTDSNFNQQAFVVIQVAGVWGTAVEMPGTAALNGGGAQVTSISCTSAGNCGADGFYSDPNSGAFRPFVADEANGTWGNASLVAGTASLNQGAMADLSPISCASAGNCGMGGGDDGGANGNWRSFVAGEVNGTWGSAIEPPGEATLNQGFNVGVVAMSCPSAGDCGAGGFYSDSAGGQQALVVNETDGTWGNVIPVPGLVALNAGGQAMVNSVSCASANHCVAGGFYLGSGGQQAFLVTET